MNLILQRSPSGQSGTFGLITHNGIPLCTTKEPVKPIIPPGIYPCKPHSGPEQKDVWEICNVPGHSAVLIHIGNYLHDTKGCVLAGFGIGYDKGEAIVINSAQAINYLRKYLPKKDLTIEIKE